MQFRLKNRILTAGILSLAMLALPPPLMHERVTYADDGDTHERAELVEHYMGKADADGGVTLSKSDIPELAVGDIVWVGVGLDYIEKLIPATSYGVGSMELAFNYNSSYLEPCDKNGKTVSDLGDNPTDEQIETLRDSWLSYIKEYSFAAGETNGSAVKWNSSYYEFLSSACTMAADTVFDWNYTNEEPKQMKMMYLYLDHNSTVTADSDLRFYGMGEKGDTTQYIMMLPFKIRSTDTPTGEYFQMSLGPQTFVMGFGEDNITHYAAWEEQVNSSISRYNLDSNPETNSDQINLHHYIMPPEDIMLLGAPSAEDDIDFLEFFYETEIEIEGTPQPTEVPVEQLYHNDVTEENGYMHVDSDKTEFTADDIETYYADVPNEASSVKLRLRKPKDMTEGPFLVSFNTGGDPVTMEETYDSESGEYVFTSAAMNLSVVNMEDENGYGTNIVTVWFSEEKKYTFKIRRYAKPRIELEYGNSPVGLIMRDNITFKSDPNDTGDSRPSKQEAIETFNTPPVNKTYGKNMVPIIKRNDDGTYQMAQTSFPYTTSAWSSFRDAGGNIINYDLNGYSLFVYYGNVITDPGYTVYNKLDLIETDTECTIKGTLTAQNAGTYERDESKLYSVDIELTRPPVDPEKGESAEAALMQFALSNVRASNARKPVRPGVYALTYECTYEGETLTAKRPLIILGRRGDVTIDSTPVISMPDATYLQNNFGTLNTMTIGNSLLSFRCADVAVSSTPVISMPDATYLKNNFGTLNVDTVNQYYPNLN